MIKNCIKQDYSNLQTFVINLADYQKNYEKQLPYLETLGLKVQRFNGINALKDEHLNPEYKQYISRYAFDFTPKSIIGCALSHTLCCKMIYDNYIKNSSNQNEKMYFLIMEDDAFPIYNNKDFYENLNKTVNDIEILDSKWELIQLHSDAFYPTQDTYNTHFACGSTAAYLISKFGIIKNLESKILSHADFIHHNFIRFRKYRSKKNLFYTDEKNSLNRNINKVKDLSYYSLYYKSYLLEFINNYTNLFKLRGEKTYLNFLEFKLFKIPYFKKEYTTNEIIDYLIAFILARKFIKSIKLI